MNETSSRDIAVKTLPIELSQFLKFGGLVESGGQAKQVIGAGRVLLNGAVETRKGRKLAPGDRVTLDGQTITVVSA